MTHLNYSDCVVTHNDSDSIEVSAMINGCRESIQFFECTEDEAIDAFLLTVADSGV